MPPDEIGGDPRLAPTKRHVFQHEGRTVYEWDQTLSEVNVYVPVPPGVRGRDLDVAVERQRLRFGLRGNPPFLDGALFAPARAGDSLWTLEDGVLHVSLSKADPGEAWPCVIAGHDPLGEDDRREERRRLLLERFQHEHPGFDFSGAAVNGDESSDIDAALELFSPPGDARPKWRLAQEGPCGRGLFAASPLPRGAAALRLPASGLLAVPLPQEGTPPTDGAPLELYERYLDAWERGNGGRALPSELRRLLLRPLVLADADDADDDDDEEANKNKTQEPVGPAARLAAFLLWAVVGSGGGGEGGEGDDDQQQQQRWRRYASAVLPRPPPSLVGAPLPSSSARPWLPDPQSMLLDAHPGELEAAASAGAGDLADKALRMRAQAASAAAAARRTLRGCGEEGQQQQEEAESWWWWWWALDMAKSRAFALAAPTSGGGGGGGTLRLAVLAPVADLLNHDDDENGVGGAACACRLDGDGDGDGPLFSLVVAARRDVREGEELTLDYTSESGLDSAALAAGYRFVPAGGCVGDRLPRHRAAAALLALSLPSPPPGRLTPELRRGLARAADALAEDAAARPAVRRRAHRALASLVEAAAGRGGGEGGGGAAEAEAEAVAAAAAAAAARAGQQELSPAVAAFLRERALLEEAAREVVARLVE